MIQNMKQIIILLLIINPLLTYSQGATKTEIDWITLEKAKQYAKSYYLYLLPVIGKNTFSTNDLEIIKNPYVETMNNSGWNKQIESYRFCKVNKKK